MGRHSEYGGGFIDETRAGGLTADAALVRASDLRADAQLRLASAPILPVSLDMRWVERTDETDLFTADVRTSAPINRYYVSTSVSYENEGAIDVRRHRLTGSIDVATLVAARAQLRGGVTYNIEPDARIQAAYVNLDFPVLEASAVRFGIIRSLGVNGGTTVQASGLYRAPRFDLTLSTAYDARDGDWTMGLQLGFGFGYDPFARRYRLSRPNVSGGGSIALDAFIDADGDGQHDAGEAPVRNVVLETPAGASVTGVDGRALTSGLGDGAGVRMRVNLEGIDDPFLVGGPAAIEVVPRPGRTAVVSYPMQLTSEVEFTVRLRRGDEARTLAAVDVQLIPEGSGETLKARTDHSGIIFLDGVRPGLYRIELDPTQALNLGLALEGTPELTAPAGGGFVRAPDVFISIASPETPQ